MKKILFVLVSLVMSMPMFGQEWVFINGDDIGIPRTEYNLISMSVGISTQRDIITLKLNRDYFEANKWIDVYDDVDFSHFWGAKYSFNVYVCDENNIESELLNVRFGVTYDMWVNQGKPEYLYSNILTSESTNDVKQIINYINNKRGYIRISGLYDSYHKSGTSAPNTIDYDVRFDITIPCIGNKNKKPHK